MKIDWIIEIERHKTYTHVHSDIKTGIKIEISFMSRSKFQFESFQSNYVLYYQTIIEQKYASTIMFLVTEVFKNGILARPNSLTTPVRMKNRGPKYKTT